MTADTPSSVHPPTHNGLPIKVHETNRQCYRCKGTGVYVIRDNYGTAISRTKCCGCDGTGDYHNRRQ